MHMSENKALPFDTEMGFTGLPKAVCHFYVRHPWFNPSAERLYRYLLSRYNPNYGYAFPSWNAIVRETQLSKGSVQSCMLALEHLDLIERKEHSNERDWNNTIYLFRKPIEDELEFQRRYKQEINDINAKKIKKPQNQKELNALGQPKPEEIIGNKEVMSDDISSWL
jgi:hypothetical protein